MSDLEPCPFCGGTTGRFATDAGSSGHVGKWGWWECDCGARAEDVRTGYDADGWQNFAIAAWNRRAPSADHVPDTGKMVAPGTVKDCLTVQAAHRAGAEAMREKAADVADAFPARNHGALATAPYAAAEQAAEEVAAAIRALPLPAGGSGWRDMTDKPTRPMPVLYWFGKRWWHQADGTPALLDPVRDPAERTEAGWWNGEEWCESGTGHDLFEPWREERDLPTHWQPLPAAPEEGG